MSISERSLIRLLPDAECRRGGERLEWCRGERRGTHWRDSQDQGLAVQSGGTCLRCVARTDWVKVALEQAQAPSWHRLCRGIHRAVFLVVRVVKQSSSRRSGCRPAWQGASRAASQMCGQETDSQLLLCRTRPGQYSGGFGELGVDGCDAGVLAMLPFPRLLLRPFGATHNRAQGSSDLLAQFRKHR